MFGGMRNQFSNTPVNISYNEFANGYAFFVFDLTSHGHGGCMSSSHNGTIRIEAKFSATWSVIDIICLADYDSELETDKFNQVIAVDY